MKRKIIIALVLTLLDVGGMLYLRRSPVTTTALLKKTDVNEISRANDEDNFKEVKADNEDCQRLLYLSDRTLPIVVSKDNKEYLAQNVQGNYDRMGTLFQAKEVKQNSQNIVIYGHSSTRNNKRLTPLKDKAYIQANSEFSVRDEDKATTYRIIAYLLVDINEPPVAFYQADWRTAGEFQNYLRTANSLSRLPFWLADTEEYASCLTLVTCDLRNKARRWVVVAIPVS